jgi:hypothetical protein
MTVPTRKLRWRVMRGQHWLDFLEERNGEAPPAFVGLIDGREAARGGDRRRAEADLIRAACA